MTTLTEITALLGKQLEGVGKRSKEVSDRGYMMEGDEFDAHRDRRDTLKIVDQYQRLGRWVGHDPGCGYKALNISCVDNQIIGEYGLCSCGLSAELEAIKKEIEDGL